MKKIFVLTLLVLSVQAHASNDFNQIIEQNVDIRFQPLAKSVLEQVPVKDVRVVQGHTVIDVDTKGMFFEATASEADPYSISDKKYLNEVTSIPFPSANDLEIETYGDHQNLVYTREFMKFRKELGLLVGPSVNFADTDSFRFGRLEMNRKSLGLFSGSVRLLVSFVVTLEKSTFTHDGAFRLYKCVKSPGEHEACGEYWQDIHLKSDK